MYYLKIGEFSYSQNQSGQMKDEFIIIYCIEFMDIDEVWCDTGCVWCISAYSNQVLAIFLLYKRMAVLEIWKKYSHKYVIAWKIKN